MNVAEAEAMYEHEARKQKRIRIRRAKQLLRPLPRKATLHRWPVLKWFANTARKRPDLWSFRIREVSLALYLGFIIAFLPIVGIQFILAFASAWVLRANLPVIMGTQLVTNLATMWAIYPALALLGDRVIKTLRLDVMDSQIGYTAFSLVTGGIIAGLALAFLLDMVYRFAFIRAKKRPARPQRMPKSSIPVCPQLQTCATFST